MSQRWYVVQKTKIVPSSTNNLRTHLQHRDQRSSLMPLLGSSPDPRVLYPSGKIRRHHLPHPKRRCNFLHPKQLSPFPERLKLPYPSGEILSGYEDVVSKSQDLCTTWVKTDPNVTLERHMVDVQKAVAEYREAAVRRQESTTQEYFFDTNVPKRSYVQKRLGIYNWNPGPRRGKEELSKNNLQENGTLSPCRRRLSMSTTNSSLKSIYLHDTRHELPEKVVEGDQGWILQGVLSRASFRRQPLIGQKTFTVLSLHIGNVYDKKRGKGQKLILTTRAVMLDENVDLVASDLNGAAWRCDNRNTFSTIEEAFAECALPMPPGPTMMICKRGPAVR